MLDYMWKAVNAQPSFPIPYYPTFILCKIDNPVEPGKINHLPVLTVAIAQWQILMSTSDVNIMRNLTRSDTKGDKPDDININKHKWINGPMAFIEQLNVVYYWWFSNIHFTFFSFLPVSLHILSVFEVTWLAQHQYQKVLEIATYLLALN